MVVFLGSFSCLSGQNYGELFGELDFIYGFQMTPPIDQLIEFGNYARPVMDFIEKLLTNQHIHRRMVSKTASSKDSNPS